MIRYSSEWFQVWYQDICYVALAAGPTLEFSFFPKRAQMPQMMSMMMLIWRDDLGRECPWMNIPIPFMSDTFAKGVNVL